MVNAIRNATLVTLCATAAVPTLGAQERRYVDPRLATDTTC